MRDVPFSSPVSKYTHVGPEVRRLPNRLRSAARFADDSEVRLRAEHCDEAVPYDRMVIGDKYADRFTQVTHRGTRTATLVPVPTLVSRLIFPPSNLALSLTPTGLF